jgi:hypothetical protein
MTTRHRSVPAFSFESGRKKLNTSHRFLNRDSLSQLDSDNMSECDIEAATVISDSGRTEMNKRDFLSFRAFQKKNNDPH